MYCGARANIEQNQEAITSFILALGEAENLALTEDYFPYSQKGRFDSN